MNQQTRPLLRQRHWYPTLATAVFFLLPLAQYFSVESSSNLFRDFSQMFQILGSIPLLRHLTGYLVLLTLSQLLILLLGRVRLALNLSVCMTSALAIGNLFVHRLHGTPFTFSMLLNAGTAAQVLSAYTITIGSRELLILGLFAAELLAVNLVYGGVRCPRRTVARPTAALSLVLVFAYIGPWPWIPKNVVGFSWNDSIKGYGYTNCLVQSTLQSLRSSTIRPENYDADALQAMAETFVPEAPTEQLPDVILILNETFYDLAQISDVHADTPYLEQIAALDNTLTGYTVIPGIGGGTNRSEYEFLTSNSLHLAPSATPFNEFSLDGASSVVSYLKGLGYETLAAHPAGAQNYKRNEGYPDLGFDHFYFQEDFEDLEYYYGRGYPSDASLYQNLIRWYEEMGEGPRLAYTLTFQNHGGHDMLEPDQMQVHDSVDYGKHDAEVDEFLTCINQADVAFVQLTQYFAQQDRDVIICMFGDHSPVFAPDLVNKDMSDLETEFRLRSTPYVIWSNHINLYEKELPEYMSAIYMTPAVLELADIPLSGYYTYMMDLMDHAPILSDFNYYVTADRQLFTYEDASPLAQQVQDYMGFAYANINREDFMVPFTAAAAQP